LYYGKNGFYRKKGKKHIQNRIDLFNMNLLLTPPEQTILNRSESSMITSSKNFRSINFSADSKDSYELISDNLLDRSYKDGSISGNKNLLYEKKDLNTSIS